MLVSHGAYRALYAAIVQSPEDYLAFLGQLRVGKLLRKVANARFLTSAIFTSFLCKGTR
jgi:hypothetical protein